MKRMLSTFSLSGLFRKKQELRVKLEADGDNDGGETVQTLTTAEPAQPHVSKQGPAYDADSVCTTADAHSNETVQAPATTEPAQFHVSKRDLTYEDDGKCTAVNAHDDEIVKTATSPGSAQSQVSKSGPEYETAISNTDGSAQGDEIVQRARTALATALRGSEFQLQSKKKKGKGFPLVKR